MGPRRSVEPFDHTAHGEGAGHAGRLPALRPHPASYGARTLATDPLAMHAASSPERVAVVVDASGGARPSTTTFGELNRMTNRLANALTSLGARAGDRLVWCGPNSLEVMTVIHAARKTGLTAVP